MKTPPVSFYLGDKEKRDARIERLERLADQLGVTRSVLLQKIADGDLLIVTPETLDSYGTSSKKYLERMGTFGFNPEDLKGLQIALAEDAK